ncbi:MAG: response regulator, partial [Gammaproteobacteria bacterium]|nr:response regulator [Gammaproteobacteria bacterium]
PVAASPQVLVIDDSITLRKLTESLLVSHGMRVVLVRDRSEALASLQDQLPDVVMIHGDMPGTDGYALAEELRGDARYSALPLIMLTSDNSRQRPEQAAAQAAQVDLAKPYREEALVDAVRAALASG